MYDQVSDTDVEDKSSKCTNIIGITLVKCFPDSSMINSGDMVSNHERMVGFLTHLQSVFSPTPDMDQAGPAVCPNLQKCLDSMEKYGGMLFCKSISKMEFSVMMGHFDFIVSVSAKELSVIEGFWLICLREATKNFFGESIISDTQTLLGVSPSDHVRKYCRELILL